MPFNEAQPSYQRLRAIYAERRRPIVFWTGAGLSQPLFPSWLRLRSQLIAEALETLVTLDRDEANRREDQLAAAERTENLWDAFEIIKKVMGVPEFNASIRSTFSKASDCDIPDAYNQIWSLKNVTGVLTLNIDGLVTRAHRRVRPQEDTADFVGRDAPDYAHLVGSQRPFIANLHGVHEAAGSWIFTRSDLRRLLSKPGYSQFINFVFSNSTVIFYGISAEDAAAGGFLEHLTHQGLDLGQHFWITSRTDAATDRWSSTAGIQMVRYNVGSDADHQSAVKPIFDDLKSFVSTDRAAPVVLSSMGAGASLPSVDVLKAMPENDLRHVLAGHAAGIIQESGGTTNTKEYADFLTAYSPCIHMAWHVTPNAPHNKFDKYTISNRVSSGTFSNVWRLYDDITGIQYALKILQIDNLTNGPEIDSFRRAVDSLRYLTQAGVPGTAKFESAFEIPTAMIMEFIEGENLRDIIINGKFNFWEDGINSIINICRHLEFAHNLPQGVLHRDVRPTNIMLPHYYWTESTATAAGVSRTDAVLLNYDLSWHANAKGQVIKGNLSEAGFYPPEQIADFSGERARSTFVDSYGIGMTLFFAYSKATPPAGGSTSIAWKDALNAYFKPDPKLKWRSSPERLRRLIENATRPEVDDRISVQAIRAELELLGKVAAENFTNLTPDIWAEELMSQLEQARYVLVDGNRFVRDIRMGRTIEITGELASRSVTVKFRNMGIEGTNWTDADKRWREKLDIAKQQLESGGWTIDRATRASHLDILLSAKISLGNLESSFAKALSALTRGLSQVRLD